MHEVLKFNYYFIFYSFKSKTTEEMLLHSSNIKAATAEIKSAGGRVTMQLGDELLVAQVPRDFIAKKNSFVSASAHIAASATPETLTYVQAYWMAREKKMKPAPPPQRWTEKTAPVALPRESPFPNKANSPYSETLTGKIAFGAIIVSGPGDLAISDSEKNKVLSEVQVGLDFWANAAPATANLQFVLYSSYVSMLPMNTPLVNVIATPIMAGARAVQRIKTVSTVLVLRAAALWIQISSPYAATQRSIWDGVTEINFFWKL